MDVYPAIDIRGGRCVRLRRGDFEQETVYDDDPVARAREFAGQGAAWLHVVDLDAALTGESRNHDVIRAISEAVDVPVQAGGGVRSRAAAEALFASGITRLVLGTAALVEPELVGELARTHRIAVGLDARAGEVVVEGWTARSGQPVLDVAARFAESGVEALVVTDVDRDGMLGGPDLGGVAAVLGASELDVVASGGVASLSDLAELSRLEVDGRRLSGVIVGKAIYEGRFDLVEARRALESACS